MTGRPTLYTSELAAEICSRLAGGDSLRTVCNADDMPARQNVFLWMVKYPEFRDQYELAKEQSAEALAEELMDIADDGSNDWMEKNGSDEGKEAYSVNGEAIQRSRLRVDARKWYLSKIKIKKYGDRQQIDNVHSGTVGVTDLTDEQLDNKIQEKMRLLNESEGDES